MFSLKEYGEKAYVYARKIYNFGEILNEISNFSRQCV